MYFSLIDQLLQMPIIAGFSPILPGELRGKGKKKDNFSLFTLKYTDN